MADNKNQAPVQVRVESPMEHMDWVGQFNSIHGSNSFVYHLLHPVSVISETETGSIVDPVQLPADTDVPLVRWHAEKVTLEEDLYRNKPARRLQMLQGGHLLLSLLKFHGIFDFVGKIEKVCVA